MTSQVSRREFLRRSAAVGAGAALAATGLPLVSVGRELDVHRPPIDLAIVNGGSPARNCLAAVDALGGMSRFVKPGDRVVVKPNPVGSNPPEMAINTHPAMVETVVRECLRVGAREVVALSNDDLHGFTANGIGPAVESAGGVLKALRRREEFRRILVPRGRILRWVEIAEDVLDADVFINMPIVKHHQGARVTLAMKNLMGVNWDRAFFHQTDLQQTIAELATAVHHHLVILDANHVLLTNGPVGPGEVKVVNQVIAGVDPVAVDAYATRYFDLEPSTIGHIRLAHDLGVGEIDLSRLKLAEFDA